MSRLPAVPGHAWPAAPFTQTAQTLIQRSDPTVGCPFAMPRPSSVQRGATFRSRSLRFDTKRCSVINECLSEIDGTFPVPRPRDNRERNGDQEQREEATGNSAVCKPRLLSIIVIGTTSIIVTTLTSAVVRRRCQTCQARQLATVANSVRSAFNSISSR